jgi:hypothetical protein
LLKNSEVDVIICREVLVLYALELAPRGKSGKMKNLGTRAASFMLSSSLAQSTDHTTWGLVPPEFSSSSFLRPNLPRAELKPVD